MQKKIIHVDMDCFYASVEIRDNPSLKGKPVAVGGSAEERGVLTTASYEARKFGLRSAMPTSRALKLCPDLVLIPVHFDKYRAESKKVREIFGRFTDKIEPLSLDEAYLDVSESIHFEGVATKMAAEIRRLIFVETGLTASAGIAPNKFLAKVASDWKKPNGQFTVTPQMVPDFVQKLKVEKIPGVGKVTAEKMHQLGLFTCRDLQGCSIEKLSQNFGSWGIKIYDLCRGADEREVSDDGERKSLSVEYTYSKDLQTAQACIEKIPELFEDLSNRLQRNQIKDSIKSLFVKIKFCDFKQTTLEMSQSKVPAVATYSKMIAAAFERGNKPVRLLGIGVRLTAEKTKPDTAQLSLL